MNGFRDRWERLELIRREKFDISLPKAMRENGVDMWIHAAKLGNPDALALDLGVGVYLQAPASSAGSISYFVFTDRGGDRIERAILGGELTPTEPVFDIVSLDADLGRFVAERDPKRIAVNMSTGSGLADGLTHTGYLRLVDDLGTKYAERLVSAEQVITDFRDRRVISEIVAYGQLCEMTRQIIEKALSNEIITPGVTSVEEVGWWLVEQVQALGADPMYTRIFTPQVIHSDSSTAEEYDSPQYIFQPGDLFQLDWGFDNMNMGSDIKRTAYILPKGKIAVPAGLQNAWDQGLKARQVLHDNIKPGRTAEETLNIVGEAFEKAGFVFVKLIHDPLFGGGWANVWSEALQIRGLGPEEKDKTQVSIDCHCVGNTGDSEIEPGPGISGFRPRSSHIMIKPNHLLAFELFANSPIPEWDKRIRLGIEDDAIVTEDGIQYLYPPNSKIRLIK